MSLRKISLLVFLFSLLNISASSQVRPVGINVIIAAMDTLQSRFPSEKVYVQTDRNLYTAGDTIWLSALVLNGSSHADTKLSALLYIELINDTSKVLMTKLIGLQAGTGRGELVLNKEVPEGSYTLRAYTNWMQNRGEEGFFTKSIYIASANAAWLVNSRIQSGGNKNKNNADSVKLELQFNAMDRSPLGLRELELRVMDGKKTLQRGKVQTTAEGELDVRFALPEKTTTKNLSITAKDQRKGAGNAQHPAGTTVRIPISMNRPENTDLQFMPEGGSLIAGIAAKVGFKAIAEDGKAAEIKGTILNGSGKEIMSFASSHKGMGVFEFTPLPGEQYIANTLLPDGTTKTYSLPQTKASGAALRINNFANDSITVSVALTADLITAAVAPAIYYLIGQTRGKMYYGATLSFKNNDIRIRIPGDKFPTGIARFTLFTEDNQPVAERIVFIDHKDQLTIQVQTDKTSYQPRDSIAIEIRSADQQTQKPIEAIVSVAVTEDSQVKQDSMGMNIKSYLLLTSDLKGTIEEPNWYFESNDIKREEYLDNLLLTQGWTGYSWKEVFNPPPIQFAAEKEPNIEVKGKVKNAFGKGIENSGVILTSMKPVLVESTQTKKDGTFIFKDLPPIDSAAFFIQARNKNNRSFNIGVEVEEFKPAKIAELNTQTLVPWYINSDTTLLNQVRKRQEIKQEEDKRPNGPNMMKEVVITGKKVIKDSWNLNGPGESDYVLDEEYMQKAKKMSLTELLQKRFGKDFKIISTRIGRTYILFNRGIGLSIDGIGSDGFYDRGGLPMPVSVYMDYLTAEDIKGIEVMRSVSNVMQYVNPTASLVEDRLPVYLEITTWSGNGAYLKKIPGVYIYKPLSVSQPKEFYRPRYMAKDSLMKSIDIRSTIHWAPNVLTDANGKASLSFYAADKPGTYTVIIEGADLNGKLGYLRKKIVISSKNDAGK